MRNRMRKHLERSHYILKYYNKIKFRMFELSRKEPILIYQMGKVGSTSMLRSIRRITINRPVFHVHTLRKDVLDDIERLYSGREIALGHHYYAGRYLSQKLCARNSEKKWRVISLVREPIARNISAFFQNLDLYTRHPDLDGANPDEIVNVMIQDYLEKFPHDTPLKWFDREIKENLGVDVYSGSFPAEVGYKIYESDRADLLLIRCEDINKCAITAIKEFLGISRIEIKNANVGSKKEYNEVYERFKNKIRLPKEYVDEMYSSQLARYFYSDEELREFRKKWLVNLDSR